MSFSSSTLYSVTRHTLDECKKKSVSIQNDNIQIIHL